MKTDREQQLETKLCQLLLQDRQRMALLQAVANTANLKLYLAAGFVRNMVWDHLHQFDSSTPLNDLDIIYFDATNVDKAIDSALCDEFNCSYPGQNWSVKNQARMHSRNGDQPYQSISDAMSFWPEKETAVAVKLNSASDKLEIIAPFGLSSLFAGHLTYNPKRAIEVFNHRVTTKYWLTQWPQLTLKNSH